MIYEICTVKLCNRFLYFKKIITIKIICRKWYGLECNNYILNSLWHNHILVSPREITFCSEIGEYISVKHVYTIPIFLRYSASES